MGIDATIYVKTKDGNEPSISNSLSAECAILGVEDQKYDDATHVIEQPWRYYGPSYTRGPWPKIAAVLMELFASENVEKVWYLKDWHWDEPLTPERVLEFTQYYMQNGNRPYREAFVDFRNHWDRK